MEWAKKKLMIQVYTDFSKLNMYSINLSHAALSATVAVSRSDGVIAEYFREFHTSCLSNWTPALAGLNAMNA